MSVSVPAPPVPAPDFAAVKSRQQATWASGDFAVVAARIVFQAEHLCEAADLQAGWRVLDVATGSGNAAIAAARLGCTAVGVDYVPALLEQGRLRASAEGLDVELLEGDAESLRHDLLALARRYDRNGGAGPVAITADYLETAIVRT